MKQSLPLTELQKALYARLSTILSVGVLYHLGAEPVTTFPHASIGDFTVSDWSNKSSMSIQVDGLIHVWSKYEGVKECQEVAEDILESLTETELSLDGGHQIIDTRFIGFTTVGEFNGTELIRHGTLTVRWLLV